MGVNRPPDYYKYQKEHYRSFIDSYDSTPSKAPNPDPNNYKIEEADEVGDFLILQITYPDATNFEGKKIMVYYKTTLIDLVNQKSIDPHFYEGNDKISPIARFEPTARGWNFAKAMCEACTSG